MRGDIEPFADVVRRYGKLLKKRDPEALALDVFNNLATLGPVDLDTWMYTPKNEPHVEGTTRTEHQRKLDLADALDECARRLRSTCWAEVTLRGGKNASYATMLATFHREQWRIARVSSDSKERELQIDHHVKMHARGAR